MKNELCNLSPVKWWVSLRRNRWVNLTGLCTITLEDLRLLVRREMEDALETHLNTEEELLPIKEVAKKIGVSTQTLHAWCRAGRLIRYKIPG